MKIPFEKSFLSLLFGLPILASAQTTTWTGATGTDWNTNANWSNNRPNFTWTGVFTGSPTANQPDMNGITATGVGLDFQTAGWTLNATGGGTVRIDGNTTNLSSAGAGVNVINANITGSGAASVTVTVGAGNTLVMNGNWGTGNAKIFAGTGTFVANGSSTGVQTISFLAGTTLLVNGSFGTTNGSVVNNGATLGGIGTLTNAAFQTLTIGSTGILAPGGNGSYGAEIGTLTMQSSTTSRTELVIDNGSISAFQIGSGGLGNNDRIVLNLNNGGNLAINAGATLSLSGTTIQDGTYTLFENIGTTSAITGTFDTVLFNGAAIDPGSFTVNYSANAITVSITGVPEPSTLAFLVGGAALLVFRRRRVN